MSDQMKEAFSDMVGPMVGAMTESGSFGMFTDVLQSQADQRNAEIWESERLPSIRRVVREEIREALAEISKETGDV